MFIQSRGVALGGGLQNVVGLITVATSRKRPSTGFYRIYKVLIACRLYRRDGALIYRPQHIISYVDESYSVNLEAIIKHRCMAGSAIDCSNNLTRICINKYFMRHLRPYEIIKISIELIFSIRVNNNP